MAKKKLKPSGKFLIPRTKTRKEYPKKDCSKCGDDVCYLLGKYFHKTPLCKKCYNMESKLKTYKITEDDYNNMLQRQNGFCALCQKETVGYIDKYTKKGKPLVIDHCHKTGGVRGLLCSKCNNGLGMFKDDIMILYKAIEYINDYNHKRGFHALKKVY